LRVGRAASGNSHSNFPSADALQIRPAEKPHLAHHLDIDTLDHRVLEGRLKRSRTRSSFCEPAAVHAYYRLANGEVRPWPDKPIRALAGMALPLPHPHRPQGHLRSFRARSMIHHHPPMLGLCGLGRAKTKPGPFSYDRAARDALHCMRHAPAATPSTTKMWP